MKTLDGSKSFSAKFGTVSGVKVLEILGQPLPGGDLAVVTMKQDSDANGTFDNTVTLPFPHISGVCMNGVISCGAGTWSGCNAWKWTTVDKRLAIVPADAYSELRSCYCINGSCGSRLVWNNLPQVLKDVGGGIAMAMQNGDPHLAVTGSEVSGPVIYFYGHNTGDTARNNPSVSATDAHVAVETMAAFGQNPTGYTDYAQGIGQSAAADPGSLYNLLYGVYNRRGGGMEQRTCKNERIVSMTQENTPVIGIVESPAGLSSAAQCVAADGSQCIRLQFRVPSGKYGGCGRGSVDFKIDVKFPEFIKKAVLESISVDDHCRLIVDNAEVIRSPFNSSPFSPPLPGYEVQLPCEISGADGPNEGILDRDITSFIKRAGVMPVSLEYAIADGGYATVNMRIESIPVCTESGGELNGCDTMQQDPKCRLYKEEVDGVVTVSNFASTGLRPLPSCKTVDTGAPCERKICRDWWETNRTYMCETNEDAWNFDDMKARVGTINNSVHVDGGILYYQDLAGGVLKDMSVGVGDTTQGAECVPACKVKIAAENTQTIPGMNVQSGTSRTELLVGGGSEGAAQTEDFSYRLCHPVTNTCPAEPGETVVLDCQCINDFTEGAVMMQVLRKFGEDTICTSGTPH